MLDDGVVLLLVRHGEQERAGQDGRLTARGRRQVEVLGRAVGLGPAERLVSSPLLRARQTAAALGPSPEVVDGLAEFRFGPSWDWQRADQRDDLLLWRTDHRVAGGESMGEFQARVELALRTLLAAPAAGRTVAVVHSGVIDAALRWAFGVPRDAPWVAEAAVGHASITELRHWPSGRHAGGAPRHTVIGRLGDVGHLSAELLSGA
jgi:broad specificity phosphatase PhoE